MASMNEVRSAVWHYVLLREWSEVFFLMWVDCDAPPFSWLYRHGKSCWLSFLRFMSFSAFRVFYHLWTRSLLCSDVGGCFVRGHVTMARLVSSNGSTVG